MNTGLYSFSHNQHTLRHRVSDGDYANEVIIVVNPRLNQHV